MSVPSYAARLSHNPNKGVVGLPELRDSERLKKTKLRKLVQFLREAKTVVCLTGAGISTSAGIADFRGPNGVWTREHREASTTRINKRRRTASNRTNKSSASEEYLELVSDSTFEQAKPTITHQVLTKLHAKGIISTIISQNVDGLHFKAHFPRRDLIELHGNVFMEKCPKCGFEQVHETDVGGIGCRPTGQKCSQCKKGEMHDTVLDWDTPISDEYLAHAEQAVSQADLILCLGTSLRIVPAAELPLLVGTARGDDIEPRIVIVNLQATPLDSQADLILHRPVDEVFEYLNETLFEE